MRQAAQLRAFGEQPDTNRRKSGPGCSASTQPGGGCSGWDEERAAGEERLSGSGNGVRIARCVKGGGVPALKLSRVIRTAWRRASAPNGCFAGT
jgi:hypothetical protein